MAKATKAFHHWDADQARTVSFEPGDTVPDAIARVVGAHVIDKRPEGSDEQVDTSAFEGEAFDAAVEAKVAAQLEVARQDATEQARAAEDAAYGAEGYGEFDPTAEGVKAKDVHDYLAGLNRDTAAGTREYDRVVAAEEAGENRSTAIPKQD